MNNNHVKLVVTGGGSGGHTSAVSSVCQRIQEQNPNIDMVWVASRTGVEREVAQSLNIPQQVITTGKLHRAINKKLIPDLLRVPLGLIQSFRFLQATKPQLIFSSGGYVAVPVVIAGWMLGIPIIIHEQTASVGLANRISGYFATKILLSYQESEQFFPAQKSIVTGNPVRKEIFSGSFETLQARFDFSPDLPLIYVTGGAQGAEAINKVIGELLPSLLVKFQILHQCGSIAETYDSEWLNQQKDSLLPPLKPRYHVVDYVDSDLIGSVFQAASVVVSRSGAGTIAELKALSLPSVLIPYPFAIKNEQLLNANILAREQLALVITEDTLTSARLLDSINQVYGWPDSDQAKTRPEFVNPADVIQQEIVRMLESIGIKTETTAPPDKGHHVVSVPDRKVSQN
ncbi:UDP-N-acetylglucosamine--N-acetylmuramyl-(pentapeptide) pyrophosphoryl-undecaprenol N-acetylglucosamine transferase [Anaerolineales bacterium HSG24]|nr:UDP-N-acetylglucosamine--N-acetylmuramyl-(pentapeptide) pyrophosphoryl-undecaprenol N-acetylglucosamine transferase [Anaerolineales bacterium HSG24]